MSELRENINKGPWGVGYGIATRRFGNTAPVAPMDPAIMCNIVDSLFPDHPIRESRQLNIDEKAPPFTKAELRMTTKGLEGRKAPGPDGILNEVLKVLVREKHDVLLDMFNACLRLGMFSRRWKIQRLILIDKGKGFPVTPSSYRPLCMLDCTGKVFERLIWTRLRASVGSGIGLVDNQFGFLEGRSTVMAIEEVTDQVRSLEQTSEE